MATNTPAVPTLTDAFSALGKALNVPPASAFNFSATPKPATPAVPQISAGMSQAPNMSTVNGPVKAPAPAIPQLSPTPASGTQHVIQSGETLSGIAAKYGTDANTLAKLNGIADPNMIKAGATLNIGGSAPKPTVPAIPQIATPGAPAAPATPAAPVGATYAPPMTTPSGLSVDPNTGTVLGASSGTPTLPALPNGSTSYNPLITSPEYEQALQGVQTASVPTQAELDAMTQLNALNTGASKAYTDTQGQPIALPFITGQQAAIQREQNTLSQPLQSQITLLQAKRTAALTASNTALEAAKDKLSAARDLVKPVSTAYGGTTSRYNPQTGQYETVVNPFGTASGGGGTGTADITTVIGTAISEGRLTADQVTRYGIPFLAATLEKDPGYNFVTQKASISSDSSSLKTQQAYADSTSRAFNTANANLSQLVTFMGTAGVNAGSTVPIINELQNKLKAGLTDPGTIAAYQAALAGLRAEYAQVLSRGGEVTEGQRAQAASLIPDNLTAAQLQQVTDRLKIEGANAIKEANDKVTEIKNRIGSNPGGSTGGAFSNTSGGNSLYDF